jgi:hypothetical protein
MLSAAAKRLILAALVCLFGACAAAGRTPQDARITLAHGSAGWVADYDLGRDAPVWFFLRSHDDLKGQPWRPRSFVVETPGVTLARVGRFDMLARTDGAPIRHVRFRIIPFAHPVDADYAPALAFSDGGIAFYTDDFRIVPLKSADAVKALPYDLGEQNLPDVAETLTIRNPDHSILLHGKVHAGRAALPLTDTDDTYAYTGPARPIDGPDFAGLIDPGLPPWIRAELDGLLPRLMRLYAERLGPPSGAKPTALVAWQGAAAEGLSLKGDVVPGMVTMAISGKQMLAPKPQVLDYVRWFFGHEASHFWVGQTVHYARAGEAWITEGGADFLAVRALQQLVPGYDPRPKLQQEMVDCLKLNGPNLPLATAEERGDDQAKYACGALLALAAEAATKRGDAHADAFTFPRRLIDANRPDREVTEKDWLDQFAKAAGSATREKVRRFVDSGAADPRSFWIDLFAATGVPYRAEAGSIILE